MATVRDARRALTRGDIDEALVALWNALEPLRLRGDRAGLKAIGEMAAYVGANGDGSQSREAERLLVQVRDLLQLEPAPAVIAARAEAGSPRRDQSPPVVVAPSEPGVDVDEMFEPDDEAADDARPGPRFGPLVWALIVAAFVIFNIVSGLLRE